MICFISSHFREDKNPHWKNTNKNPKWKNINKNQNIFQIKYKYWRFFSRLFFLFLDIVESCQDDFISYTGIKIPGHGSQIYSRSVVFVPKKTKNGKNFKYKSIQQRCISYVAYYGTFQITIEFFFILVLQILNSFWKE